jgi:hypothetical protein
MEGRFTADYTFCQSTGKVNGVVCRQRGGRCEMTILLPCFECPGCSSAGKDQVDRCQVCSGYGYIAKWRFLK